MTRKEFREHDWKLGEQLYMVLYREYGHIKIPYKVCRSKVTNIIYYSHDVNVIWLNIQVNNKRDYKFQTQVGFGTKRAYGCESLFFDKKKAEKEFSIRMRKFGSARNRVRNDVNAMICEHQKEIWELCGILQMNAMKQE